MGNILEVFVTNRPVRKTYHEWADVADKRPPVRSVTAHIIQRVRGLDDELLRAAIVRREVSVVRGTSPLSSQRVMMPALVGFVILQLR
jgi:hypothetical protein